MVSGKKSENQLQSGNTFFSNSLSYMPYNGIKKTPLHVIFAEITHDVC